MASFDVVTAGAGACCRRATSFFTPSVVGRRAERSPRSRGLSHDFTARLTALRLGFLPAVSNAWSTRSLGSDAEARPGATFLDGAHRSHGASEDGQGDPVAPAAEVKAEEAKAQVLRAVCALELGAAPPLRLEIVQVIALVDVEVFVSRL